jgi:beta-galactosidase GanA
MVLALAGPGGAPPARAQTKSAAPLPRLEKRGAATQLMVDGKPFLALAGELGNNTSSTLENMEPYWPALAKANLNAVLAAVAWSWIEPEEGRFDFSLVDGLIQAARRHHLRLVFLWFGSWKNGTSSYPPAWVKRDFERFPLARDKDGKGREILSTLSETNRGADARAFAALMRHIREVDSQARTVIMIQVENEVGVLGDSRDRCPEANEAFARPVPQELIDYLQKHKDTLLPEFRKLWEAAGFKTSGTWEEVFGQGTATDEIFMAWNYARYLGRVAEAGKKEYPLPMYVNAWIVQPQDKRPGDYPSGGPVDHMHDVWRAGAPQIDILSPDIYLPNFVELCARYSRSGNPLFIPETRADAANLFYAVGHFNAMGFSPFGIERQTDSESLFARSYATLSQLAPLVLANQGKGTMESVIVEGNGPAQKVPLGNYTFNVSMARGRMGAPPPQPTAGAPLQPPARGFGIFISAGPDEYWVSGSGLSATVEPNTPGPPLASLASVEEGTFANGRWVIGRRLAGDDTGQGGEARASLRLPANRVGILHVKVYRYR